MAGAMLLGSLILLLPLAQGGAGLWAEAGAVLIAITAAVVLTSEGISVAVSAFALLAVVLLELLQLIPMPTLIHRLSPGALRVFEISLTPLGLYPASRPLSIDPAATARELAKSIACFATFVGAFALSSTHRKKHRVLLALALSGVVLAGAVLGLALIGAGSYFAPHLPFVNRNHLAAALNLSVFIALAFALEAHGQRRLLWLLGIVTTGTVSVLTLSRGGVLGLLAGVGVFAGLNLRSRDGSAAGVAPLRLRLGVGVLCLAFGTAMYLALDPLLAKLGTVRDVASDVRWQLWRPALQVLGDFPVFGVGRGAFPDVFAGYQLESATYEFTHVENEWLQAVLDLGLPGGLLLIAAFAWTWVAAARRLEPSLRTMGLLAGTAAVAVHNLFDFSLSVLGVSIPFSAAMGLLARRQRSFHIAPGKARGAAGALAVLALTSVLVAFAHGREADEARVTAARTGASAALAARAAARWHPADWLPHAVVGAHLSAERDCTAAMAWLSRSMALYPSAPSTHLAAARCLAGHDDNSARREYRLAILLGSNALPEAVLRYPQFDRLLEIAPDTPDGMIALGDVLSVSRPLDAKVAYARALDQFADDRALLRLARVSEALDDHEGALAYARRHQDAHKAEPAGYAVAARALLALGRDDEAVASIERGLVASPGSAVLLGLLADHSLVLHRWAEARRRAEEIAPRTPEELANKHLLVARSLAGQERTAEAIDRVRSAEAAQPDRSDVLMTLASLCERAGRLEEALDAMRRLAALPGVSPADYAGRISTLQAAIAARDGRPRE